jgi:mono/diheme cytochrome c family protein
MPYSLRRPMVRRRRTIPVLAVAAVVAAGCGSQSIDLPEGESESVQAGARIFVDKCAGCHTMEVTGSEGSNVSAFDKERVDGPNFNARKVERDQTLYALRNGGFSGAIMPENIVTGQEAEDVAEFLEKYSGDEAEDADSAGS